MVDFESHTNLRKLKLHFANGIEQNMFGLSTITRFVSSTLTDLEVLGTPADVQHGPQPAQILLWPGPLIRPDWRIQRLSVPAEAFFDIPDHAYLVMPNSLKRLELWFEQTAFNRELESPWTDLRTAINGICFLREDQSLCSSLVVKARIPLEHFGDTVVQEVCKISLCKSFPCTMVSGGEPDEFIRKQDGFHNVWAGSLQFYCQWVLKSGIILDLEEPCRAAGYKIRGSPNWESEEWTEKWGMWEETVQWREWLTGETRGEIDDSI